MIRSLGLALLLCVGIAPGGLSAQEPDVSSLHPEAREAIDGLWSPYCPGMMLEVCPSAGGQTMRDSIESLARSGLDGDSIIELMLTEYGEEYRAEPRSEGIGGLAWYIPPAAFVAGIVVVGAFLARRRGRRPFQTSGAPPSEAEQARLREAMLELDATERPDF